MTFLNPTLALAGLAAVSIPILIHILMRRRRKPVMWGAMRFLLEAYRKQKQRLRLEQLLLLAARCLIVALIALALGRPLLGAGGLLSGRGATTVYLVVDNSLTSAAEDAEGHAALERSRRLALGVLGGLDAAVGDRAGLIALGGPAEALVVPASSDLGAVRGLVEALRPTDSAADLDGGARQLREELGRQGDSARAVVVVLGGFLSGSGGPETVLPSLVEGLKGASVTLLASRPDAAGATNTAIAGVQPVRTVILAGDEAEATNQVRVLLRRFGPGVGEEATTTVRVRIAREGEEPSAIAPPAEAVVRWAPGQTEATGVVAAGAPGRAGQGVIVAEIDRDPVAGDNIGRRPVQVRESLRVGLIAPRLAAGREGLDPESSADWLRLALVPAEQDRAVWRGKGGDVEVIGIEPGGVDASRLSGLDVAVVAAPEMLGADAWRRLRGLADSGGVVMVLPPAGAAVHLWTDEMVKSLGLDWTIGRETRVIGTPGDAAAGMGLASQRPQGADLLEMVASELAELVKPVHVWRALPVSFGASPVERVLTLADGTPWVMAAPPGSADDRSPGRPGAQARGLVVFFASSLSIQWTDLAGKPLLVPLVQELVRQGVGAARPAWSEVAGRPVETPARTVELRPDPLGNVGARPGADEDRESIPVDASGHAANPVRRTAILRAVDERGATRGLVAVNADTRASATEAQPPQSVAGWLGGLTGGEPVRWLDEGSDEGASPGGAVMAARTDDTQPSLPLLVAALLIGIAELAMARWFSHATIAPEPAGVAA